METVLKSDNRISPRASRRFTRLDGLWLALFVLAVALCLWKCPYSFGTDDEPFYYTVAHRLVLGDRLFSDEWHVSQLYSFFLYPYVAVYMKLNGSTEGMVLTARYIYLALHALLGVLIWLRLRRHGIAAALISVVYVLFSPFDIMTYCYNNTALDLLTLGGLLSAWEEDGPTPARALALSGFCFAGAVICCPYLAAVWFVWALAVVILALARRGKTVPALFGELFEMKTFLTVTAGVCGMAVLFLIFFFRFSSLPELFENLPYVMADPEHPGHSVLFMLKHYVWLILTAEGGVAVPLGLYALSLLALLLDKNRSAHRAVHFTVALLLAVGCECLLIPRLVEVHYNSFVFPALMPGFTAYLLLRKRPVKLFWSLFAVGLLYSVCVGATSNLGFRVIAMAGVVSDVAGFVFAGDLLRELKADNAVRPFRAAAAAALLLAALLPGLEIASKVQHCYWSSAPAQMTQTVQSGPGRGLKEDAANIAFYEGLQNDLQFLADKEPENVLVFSNSTWGYLMLSDFPYGTFSAWLSGPEESSIDRLLTFYELHPEKIPTYIVVTNNLQLSETKDISEYVQEIARTYGYTVQPMSTCWILTAQNAPAAG